MVQIILYTEDEASGVSWSLGPNCASPKQIAFHVEANKIYQESCTLLIGISYELKCNSYAENGWSGSFLVIENKAYCQNFQAGSKENATIKIEGNYILIATERKCLSNVELI